VMDWRHIRHVPVEDEEGKLVGVVSHRALLRLLIKGQPANGRSLTVREIMIQNPLTVSSTTPTLEAMAIMRRDRVGCLPVVDDGLLVGIVTSFDFLDAAARLFKRELSGALSVRPAEPERVAGTGLLLLGGIGLAGAGPHRNRERRRQHEAKPEIPDPEKSHLPPNGNDSRNCG